MKNQLTVVDVSLHPRKQYLLENFILVNIGVDRDGLFNENRVYFGCGDKFSSSPNSLREQRPPRMFVSFGTML